MPAVAAIFHAQVCDESPCVPPERIRPGAPSLFGAGFVVGVLDSIVYPDGGDVFHTPLTVISVVLLLLRFPVPHMTIAPSVTVVIAGGSGVDVSCCDEKCDACTHATSRNVVWSAPETVNRIPERSCAESAPEIDNVVDPDWLASLM